METLAIIISCASLAAVVVVGLLIWSRLKELAAKPPSDGIQVMQQQVDSLRQQTQGSLENMNASLLKTLTALQDSLSKQTLAVTESLNRQLASLNSNVAQRIEQQAKVFADFKERIGVVDALSKNLGSLSKEISNFQQILQAPKLRGGLGEFMLEELLSQILPADCYETQFTFTGNEKVDAIIRLKNGIVPVDAKFPLENFRRAMSLEDGSDEWKRSRKDFAKDVMKHIDDIAAKYIRPAEGTLDFAFMYIPAENVYYETIVKDASHNDNSIPVYARSRRVIPVSPNSFWAYLQVIAMGLKGLRLEQSVQEVMAHLGRMSKDIENFAAEFDVLGKHLHNAHSKYEEAASQFSRMSTRIQQIADVRALDAAGGTIPLEAPARSEHPGSDPVRPA
jgi:DNA recombination protein RmuC